MSLERVLRRIPDAYADLADAALPGRSGEPPTASPDPRDKPAPGNLSVMEHRHKLVRGLRWWVDAVRERGQRTEVGHDVTLMARWLLAHLHVMAEEDRLELRANLNEWLSEALEFMGNGVHAETRVQLPADAADREVAQAVAAKILGCPVSTIWRRAGKRGGPVRLGDVAGPPCEFSGLSSLWCDHCRGAQ